MKADVGKRTSPHSPAMLAGLWRWPPTSRACIICYVKKYTLDRGLAHLMASAPTLNQNISEGNDITRPRPFDYCCFRYVTMLTTRSKEAINIWDQVCLLPVEFDGTLCTYVRYKNGSQCYFFFNFCCGVGIVAPVPCPGETRFILYTEICRVLLSAYCEILHVFFLSSRITSHNRPVIS